MLVKQWLREFLSSTVISQEHCRTRLFRIRGLRTFKVTEVAYFLPILLQISIILFFAGLVIFVQDINTFVGWVVTGLVAIWFLLLVVTTLAPMVSASCPYKTPFFRTVFILSRRLWNSLWRAVVHSTLSRAFSLHVKLPDRLVVEETELSKDPKFDHEVLFDAYKTIKNVHVWETITRCVNVVSMPYASHRMLVALVKQHLDPNCDPQDHSIFRIRDIYGQDELRYLLKSMITCLRKAFHQTFHWSNDYYLGGEEADALIILEKLGRALIPESEADKALIDMTKILWQGAFSVLCYPEFFDTYIPWRFQHARNDLPETVNTHGEWWLALRTKLSNSML